MVVFMFSAIAECWLMHLALASIHFWLGTRLGTRSPGSKSEMNWS